MITSNTYTSQSTGKTWNIEYKELDNFDAIRNLPVGAAGALCFYGDKLVLVYAKKRDMWEMPGGGREEGETFEECVIREIKEESNMRVIELFPIALETNTYTEENEVHYVLRYAAKVEPYGDFVSDPADGEITAMKLVDPEDFKLYFDWGERGEAMMKKALKLVK